MRRLGTTSLSGFASATWRASDQLDFTVGGRYTYEEKDIDYVQTDPLGLLGGSFSVKADDTWSQFTPNASARYRFSSDLMGYATVSQGFKSGGFNDALGDANGIGYDPETVWNYEIGLKSEFMDRRVLTNVALYYMDWNDIQLTNDNPATPIFDPIILNAGKAHSTGIELEIQAAATERLMLGATLSVQEAEYDEGALPNGQPLRRIPLRRGTPVTSTLSTGSRSAAASCRCLARWSCGAIRTSRRTTRRMGASTITRFIMHGSTTHPSPDAGTSRCGARTCRTRT